jgi:2-dehydro-3-deoxygluconokinase
MTVVCIGECMVELARGSDGRFGLAYGGDTFNTAVYLARAGVPVAYMSALGDDVYSQGIRGLARDEGVDATLIGTAANRMPGLYLIETTPAGERTFNYWRDRAPAREVFDEPLSATTRAALLGARMLYLSGITLSLYGPAALDRLAETVTAARHNGARFAMDGNYRPRGWGGDVARARDVMARFWALADIALPTFEDEQMLWGDARPSATSERLGALGVREIIVKCGAEGAHVTQAGGALHVPCPVPVSPLDTTAAGDSFNAGFLAARLQNTAPEAAALAGHRLAAVVIQHRGAIVPKAATAGLFT